MKKAEIAGPGIYMVKVFSTFVGARSERESLHGNWDEAISRPAVLRAFAALLGCANSYCYRKHRRDRQEVYRSCLN